MSNFKVPQFQPYIDNKEYDAIKSCFDSNWITEGPLSKRFVDKILQLTGAKYGVLAPNGTLSIYMALRAIGVGPGDEVIVPNFTFIASANAVEMCGAKPVFVDVKEDLQIDVDKCIRLVNHRTKAIMPVHVYGMACDMDEIMEFAKNYKIKVVEDAAQGIGITWKGKHTGTFGDVGSFSFFADKTLTTGEGGMVVTNDKDLYEKLLYLRNQGRIDRGSFIHPELGYNFRMTDLQSAIGLSQFEKLPEIIEKKSEILKTYKNLLNPKIKIIEPSESSNHIPFRVCIIIPNGSQKLMEYMKENGIETRTFFYPLHKQPCYMKKKKTIFEKIFFEKNNDKEFEVSIRMYNEGVCLPSFVSISQEQISFICQKINEYVQ